MKKFLMAAFCASLIAHSTLLSMPGTNLTLTLRDGSEIAMSDTIASFQRYNLPWPINREDPTMSDIFHNISDESRPVLCELAATWSILNNNGNVLQSALHCGLSDKRGNEIKNILFNENEPVIANRLAQLTPIVASTLYRQLFTGKQMMSLQDFEAYESWEKSWCLLF